MVSKSEMLALEESIKEPRRKPTRTKKKHTSRPSSEASVGTSSKLEEPAAKHEKPAAEPEKRAKTVVLFEAPELVTGRMYEDMGAEIFVEPPQAETRESPRSSPGHEANMPAIADGHHEGAGATHFPSRKVVDQRRYEAYRPPTTPFHEVVEGSENHQNAPSVAIAVPVRHSTHTDNRSPVELPADRLHHTPRAEHPAQPVVVPDREISQEPKDVATNHHKTVSIARKETLAVPVRHSPPPRTTSPIKSALKHPAGSNRNSSMSDPGSEASSDVMHQQPDPAATRKKNVRVSFDADTSPVEGPAPESDTPERPQPISLPAAKKRWYTISRRRDSGASLSDGEDEEIMKPRPMLPSFESIREKKARIHEERPLVRPQTFAHSPPSSTPPSALPSLPSDSDLGKDGASFSSDHAIGTALTIDLAHRHKANTSRLREPLPPQVTSVEGDGFMSDDSSNASLLNSDGEESEEPPTPPEGDKELATPASTTQESRLTHAEERISDAGAESDRGAVDSILKAESSSDRVGSGPQIAVSDPSPRLKEEVRSDSSAHSSDGDEFFDVPGAFPENDGADKETLSSCAGSKDQAQSSPSKRGEIRAEGPVTSLLQTSSPSRELPTTIEEESEESAIFSDAYEDLDGVDGDGFQSLDAVADSPVRSTVSTKTSNQAGPSIAENMGVAKNSAITSVQSGTSDNDQPVSAAAADMSWEQAKAYWRGLSAEKRKQLELEATQEAAAEADLDEPRLATRTRKKRPAKKVQPTAATEERLPTEGGRFMRKTLRGSRPASSDSATSGTQSQSGGQGMLRTLRSPPPSAPSDVSSDGGMRKSLRIQRSPDVVAVEGHPKEKRPLSMHLPTPSLGLAQKLKTKQNRNTISLDKHPNESVPADWTSSLPQRRSSISSESSFKRSTPRPESTGFRKTMRSGSDSPGMVPGSNAGKMGSFSLRSSSPPHHRFRRNSSLGSSPSASPGSKKRNSLRDGSSDGSPRHQRSLSFGIFSKKRNKQRARDLDDFGDEDVAVEVPSSPTAHRSVMANGSRLSKATATPANGPLQEESEGLPDSNTDVNQPQPAAAPSSVRGLTISAPVQGSFQHSRSGPGLQTKQTKSEHSRKGSFISALRRHKGNNGGISRPERMESAARRDTKLERSAAELEALRSPTPGQGLSGDEDDESVELQTPSPRRRLEKRGGSSTGGLTPEGKKKRFSGLRKVLKMDA